MFISIGLLILVIVIEEIFSYYLLKEEKEKPILNKISIILIVLFYMVFINLTYNPPKNYIFYDVKSENYGINENNDN